MYKAFLLAFASAIAIQHVESNGDLPICDGHASGICSTEQAEVDFVFSNPGECKTNECSYKPKRGYTENPENNYKLLFEPAKFTKKIMFTFKTFKAEVCAYKNQMCYCKDPTDCNCEMKEGSFCRQQYRTEQAFFLVFDDKPQTPTPPPTPKPYKPVYHPHPYPPKYHHQYYPPPQNTPPPPPTMPPTKPPTAPPPPPPSHGGMYAIPQHLGQNSAPSEETMYQFPGAPEKRNLMLQHLMSGNNKDMSMMMSGMTHPLGLLGNLFGDEGKESEGDDMMKYLLLSKMMNKQPRHEQPYYKQPYHQQPYHNPYYHYDHPHQYGPPPMPPTMAPSTEAPTTDAPAPEAPATPPPPQVGSYFNPQILMYMMSKNSGGKGNKMLLQLLPYLGNNSPYRLKMESLFVRVPSGCSCKVSEKHDIDPMLKYFFYAQRYPQGKMPGFNPYKGDAGLPHIPYPF